MVNLVAAQRPMLIGFMKMAGVVPHTVEIEPGTSMNFWVPKETINTKPKKSKDKPKQNKPVVVLVHGFAAEGIVTWQFQIGSLTKKYAVYVPDLLFFGGSMTDSPDRSPRFQAECLSKGLKKLGCGEVHGGWVQLWWDGGFQVGRDVSGLGPGRGDFGFDPGYD
ncbi:hypothetical protein RHGRI_023616 [Rhododendron griersonianum]|uniref:AB hydrolase-1 domain-containing protein n=1 Tax=Rhododendron griersonianum TaxID=479676 RepID=A0AAV6J9K3_9ERIC|nr:hypothetical protein RHGRI_023616 [Rhododendron griersonianum]